MTSNIDFFFPHSWAHLCMHTCMCVLHSYKHVHKHKAHTHNNDYLQPHFYSPYLLVGICMCLCTLVCTCMWAHVCYACSSVMIKGFNTFATQGCNSVSFWCCVRRCPHNFCDRIKEPLNWVLRLMNLWIRNGLGSSELMPETIQCILRIMAILSTVDIWTTLFFRNRYHLRSCDTVWWNSQQKSWRLSASQEGE